MNRGGFPPRGARRRAHSSLTDVPPSASPWRRAAGPRTRACILLLCLTLTKIQFETSFRNVIPRAVERVSFKVQVLLMHTPCMHTQAFPRPYACVCTLAHTRACPHRRRAHAHTQAHCCPGLHPSREGPASSVPASAPVPSSSRCTECSLNT